MVEKVKTWVNHFIGHVGLGPKPKGEWTNLVLNDRLGFNTCISLALINLWFFWAMYQEMTLVGGFFSL